MIIGGYVLSVGYFARGFGYDFGSAGGTGVPSTHGESRRFLGFGVFLVLGALGYALVVLRRRGPLATGGTVLSAFSVPAALGFAFLDLSSTLTSGASPINIDAVYLISIAIWLASYLVVPGARGRAVYLAAAAIGLPSYIGTKAGGNSALQLGASAVTGSSAGGSDTGAVATVALVFGLGYYLIAALLDRADRGGVAVALVVAAFTTTTSGIALAATNFGQLGTGALLVVVGVLVALYGARYGRRFTTWVWVAAAALGVVVMVAKLGVERYAAIAFVLMAIGVVSTLAAHVASGALHEQPDVVEEAATPV